MKRPVWSGDWPMPSSVSLPGMRVRVRVLSAEEAAKANISFGTFTYASVLQARPHATVRINGGLPLPVQRYTLIHELQHALVDGLDQLIEKFPESVQSCSMAAMKLEEVAAAAKEGA